MKAVLRRIGLCVVVGMLAFGLMGCSSSADEGGPAPSDSYIEINGERMTLDELVDKIGFNKMDIYNNFIGKPMTVVGQVVSIGGNKYTVSDDQHNTQAVIDCDYGYVTVRDGESLCCIQISEADSGLTGSLQSGDYIKASGVFSGFKHPLGGSMEIAMMAYDGNDYSDAVCPRIEKIDQ